MLDVLLPCVCVCRCWFYFVHQQMKVMKKIAKHYICNNKMDVELFWYFNELVSMWLDTLRLEIST